MRRNVTTGFSPQEFLRLHGAAAVAQMPVSSYVKWLLPGSPNGVNGNMRVILSRPDDIFVAIARLSSAPGAPTVMPLRAHATAPRERLTACERPETQVTKRSNWRARQDLNPRPPGS